jgi:dynein heavy chain
MLFADF